MKNERIEKEYVDSYRQGNSCLTKVVLILVGLLLTLLIIGLIL